MRILLILLIVLFHMVFANEEDLCRIDAIFPEEPCNTAGGMCTIATDCPAGNLAEQKGLCPRQQTQGIECCYGISVQETRCGKRGGTCLTGFCNKNLIFKNASDCKDGYKCCIMV